jgi:MarR family transcriptional regulator for hemolysin
MVEAPPGMTSMPRSELESAVGQRLFEVVRNWRRSLGVRLAPHGLSEATWRVLLHIDLLGGRATQATLASRVGVEPPTMVRLVDRMERDGWVRRTTSAQDRRVNWVEPTAAGRKVIRKVATAASGMRRDALRSLSADELWQALSLLERIAECVGAGAAADPATGAAGRRRPATNGKKRA